MAQDLLFKSRPANNAIIFLSPLSRSDADTIPEGRQMAAKIFLPYDAMDPPAGGRSFFVFDRQIERILEEVWNISPARTPEKFEHDFRVLSLLDRLSNFAPFLIQDALKRNNLNCNPQYFDLTAEEIAQIEGFIREKFSVLSSFFTALSEQNFPLEQAVDKLWRADDRGYLVRLFECLGISEMSPEDLVLSWRGILYFEYAFEKAQANWAKFIVWFRDFFSVPERVPVEDRLPASRLKEEITGLYRENYFAIKSRLETYKSAFDLLFRDRREYVPFRSALLKSTEDYWEFGDRMSRLDLCYSLYINLVVTRGDGMSWAQAQPLLHYARDILALEVARSGPSLSQ